MFNSSNDCFISSPSSPSNLIFNRQHHNSRYHPYNRISTSYHPTNEFETYSFDNNNSTIQNYDHSIMSYDYNHTWTIPCSSIDNEINIEEQTTIIESNRGGTGVSRCFKRRVSANKKERRRTQSINTAFSDLRTAIPNVQPDTKLSKIKTLKLATKYIEFLMDILAKDDPIAMPSAFKAEIIKTRKDHRDLMKFNNSLASRKIKGRTGWPQTVWQSELNRNENFHQQHHSNNETILLSPTLSHSSSSSSIKMNKLRTYDKSYIKK
ncbi:unnamed protein product [Rotaria sp. Silwood1]|nr:unnamed protein product [Rotaria sp. Silwood1]CAF1505031.1 unnamed protein product [Rotaria sp. Silwood1]CAF1686910.1 unnamed protein product [Rotaria sp. Silwood1]CAF1686920.1 unnamed protein product [Rotaria sp. Silwood1]CAF4946213.1 unnamed protein product [Rotaria sp. Silwood1]